MTDQERLQDFLRRHQESGFTTFTDEELHDFERLLQEHVEPNTDGETDVEASA